MNYVLFKSSLLQAVQANDNSLVLELLSEHSSYTHSWKDLITKNGDTVVHLAAHSGCVSIIKYYADHGSRVILEHKNCDGKTPLHIAAHSGQLECVKYLLSSGVSVNALKRSDWTPLMLACTKSNLDIIKELLSHGADVNISNKDGWTAFHIASREGNVDIIQYLLDLNPLAWNTKSKNGRTPLHTASLHGHLELVKIFSECANYDINVKDSCGITPLMDAVSGNHNQVVEFLVEKGASLNEQDKLGRNVLHLAAEAGNMDCIKYLVECHHISVDSQTPQGVSPLHFACKENEIDTFYLLLELGANAYLKDNQGRTGRNTRRNFIVSSPGSAPTRSNLPKILEAVSTSYPTTVEEMKATDGISTTTTKLVSLLTTNEPIKQSKSETKSLTQAYTAKTGKIMETDEVSSTTMKSIASSTAMTSTKNTATGTMKLSTKTSDTTGSGKTESEKKSTPTMKSTTETSSVTNSPDDKASTESSSSSSNTEETSDSTLDGEEDETSEMDLDTESSTDEDFNARIMDFETTADGDTIPDATSTKMPRVTDSQSDSEITGNFKKNNRGSSGNAFESDRTGEMPPIIGDLFDEENDGTDSETDNEPNRDNTNSADIIVEEVTGSDRLAASGSEVEILSSIDKSSEIQDQNDVDKNAGNDDGIISMVENADRMPENVISVIPIVVKDRFDSEEK